MVRLKSVADLITDCYDQGPLPYLALENLESETGHMLPDVELPEREAPEAGAASVEPGDVLFGKLRPYLAKSLLAHRRMYASTELLCLRPGKMIDSRWLSYLISSKQLVEWAVATSDGAKMPRTSWDKLAEFRVDVPALRIQRDIADFLDAETARIDALIENKRRMVELLEERRTTAMSDGVSGQLSRGELIPSGLPWVTARGPHWRVAKLSLVAQLGSGHTPSRDHPEWWTDATIPWITTGEVSQMRSDRIEFITDTREMISEEGIANSAAVVHPAGTVVLCRTASAGYSAIMGIDMATSQDFATWTCGPLLNPRFLLLCLRVMRQDLLGRLAMGSTHKTIYMPDIESLQVPLPPLDQQQRIVEAVWEELHHIDRVVNALGKQITVLVERRQALITAAVTGELEIAGIAA